MSRLQGPRFTTIGALAAGALVLGLTVAGAQPDPTPLKLTAFAINLGANHPAATASIVEIRIDRWSTEGERQALLDTLQAQGPDHLLAALRKTPRVGYIRTPDKIAWDLHYAHETPTDDGGRRIFIGTDRRIGFWEAANLTRSLDYPFTVIEIHLDKNGKGEGKMSIATKVLANPTGKHIELENYSALPVRLQQVEIQRK
jgi:hypothetical protein